MTVDLWLVARLDLEPPGTASTLRENIYEPGQRRLRDDHPGARHRLR